MATLTWLVARRNEIELRFPLQKQDRRYLARLLLGDCPATLALAPMLPMNLRQLLLRRFNQCSRRF